MRRTRFSLTLLVTMLLLVTLVLTGCMASQPAELSPVDDGTDPAPAPRLSGPADGVEMEIAEGLELSPEELEAAQEAVEALRNFLNYEDSLLRGSLDGADLAQEYMTGEVLDDLTWLIGEYREHGYERRGEVRIKSIEVTSARMSGAVPAIDLAYCADASGMQVVHKADGAHVEGAIPSDEFYLELRFVGQKETWLASEFVERANACP